MSTEFDLRHAHILKQGVLPKTGEGYALVLLGIEHIDHIVRLQEEVFEPLKNLTGMFLMERDRKYFEKHFALGNPTVGIVHNGRLIAQSLLTLPSAAFPDTSISDMKLPSALEDVIVFNGSIVHPDYRGNGLQSVMTEARLEVALKNERRHLVSDALIENHHSWITLLKAGFNIHSIGHDPSDNTSYYNLHLDSAPHKGQLTSAFNEKSGLKKVECHKDDIARQKKLLSLGYKGISFDSGKGSFTFARPSKKRGPDGLLRNE